MKKILLIILLIILVAFGFKRFFLHPAAVVSTTPPPKEGKIVETSTVGESIFSEQIHITGKVAAQKEVSISTQTTGFIGSLAVKSGDKVTAGETLAHIQDTYGTTNNSIREASLGIQTAQLSQENSTTSLDQAVENTRIAYEKAQKDYAAAQLGDSTSGSQVSKAQLDLENYITTQEKTLSGYETSYQSQLQNFQSLVANVIDMSDTLLGVSSSKSNLNDSYEHLLSALDSQKKAIAVASLEKLLAYKNWTPDSSLSLTERIGELQRVYVIVSEVLTNTKNVLLNSLTDGGIFTPTMLANQRALIDTYQAQYSAISGGLVTFLNTTQSFLATYEKDRSARELAASTAENNALTALELAKKAYETAVKTRDTSLRQTDASVALAAIRYDTAAGNAGRLSIIAPFSGVIITKNIDTGSLVNPGMSLFVLGDTSTLIVKAEMTGEQQSTLRIGQDIPLVISGQTITGTLKSLGAGPDPITHLYKAEITLPKNHPTIALGDIVDVIVNRVNTHKEEPKKEIVVPFSALKNLGQETYAVYILTPDIETPHAGIVHERIVKIGATNETSVTIVDGLTLGETIVSRGTLMIEDGDYVQEATDAAIEVPAEESNS